MPGVLPERSAGFFPGSVNNYGWRGRRHDLFKAQFWVEPDQHDIGSKIQGDDKKGVEYDRTHDHEVIAIEGGSDEIAAQAGDGENGFDDKRACQQSGDGRAKKGDDRQNSAAKGMLEEDTRASPAPLARAVRM